MDFEEFSRQFRERTAQRMVEFEKALARAQERVEKSVEAPKQVVKQHSTPRTPATRGRVQGVLRKN
ncbi:hypothetical protein CATRI_02305 [Corynebacterium atrinae]|uniref:hypothetical protein n=1 Tax=Corynebacterium atrinae TaxID=1336740 RepID=UPI0025B5260D|nr:hypothetical protein [Corynebacterium atrinae]WJY62566.1 hypothetical protein CATRI_02305 [Corynebacterium atrinae]